ncbi:MAG: oligosaccharide flippase family protein, partial [bacterium]|nr:oligosaccharide flippase family protein [bacterium]
MASISFLQQIVQFVVQIVLARLLLPDDYGTAAIVMAVCVFAVVFSSAGIGTALVQRKELNRELTDAVATITGGFALLLGGLLFFGSGWIASFYSLPALSLLFKIAAIDIFLKVMISLYDGLMLREMQYRSLSLRTFVGLLTQATVSIVLASMGCGALSLVVGYVAGSAMQLFLCICATRYWPRSFGNWRASLGVFQFGGWILLGRIANQAAVTLDQLILGRFLNVASLGLLNVSKNLSSLIPHTVMGFAGRLTLPVFSQWQDNLARIELNYWRGMRFQLLIVTPLCVIIAISSYQILSLLFGLKWLDGNMVMKIYAIQAIVWSMEGGLTASVFNALGKPKFGIVTMILSIGLIPLCAFIGSCVGIIGVAVAFLLYAVIILAINQYILWIKFGFKVKHLFSILWRQFVATLPLLVGGYGLAYSGLLPFSLPPAVWTYEWFGLFGRLILFGLACMTIYLISIRFLLK